MKVEQKMHQAGYKGILAPLSLHYSNWTPKKIKEFDRIIDNNVLPKSNDLMRKQGTFGFADPTLGQLSFYHAHTIDARFKVSYFYHSFEEHFLPTDTVTSFLLRKRFFRDIGISTFNQVTKRV